MNIRTKFDLLLIKDKKYVLGIDEVGWGCVAGPLVLGACLIPVSFYKKFSELSEKHVFLKDIRDSKKISEKKRQFIFSELLSHKSNLEIELFLGEASVEMINKEKLAKSYSFCIDSILKNVKKKSKIEDVLVLIDGNRDPKSSEISDYSLIIKGDDQSYSIGVASLYAKEFRDSKMRELDLINSSYDFKTNKGYGTKSHKDAIIKNGLSKEHRIEASLKLINN